MTPATSSIGHGRTVIVGPVRYAELCGTGRRMLLDHGFTLVENESTVPWTQAELHELLQGADAAERRAADAAAAPVGAPDRVVLLGRPGGPRFRASEVLRLTHLAGIAATVALPTSV